MTKGACESGALFLSVVGLIGQSTGPTVLADRRRIGDKRDYPELGSAPNVRIGGGNCRNRKANQSLSRRLSYAKEP